MSRPLARVTGRCFTGRGLSLPQYAGAGPAPCIGPCFLIVPMHLTILFGVCTIAVIRIYGFEPTLPVLVVFPLLRTAPDPALHTGNNPGKF